MITAGVLAESLFRFNMGVFSIIVAFSSITIVISSVAYPSGTSVRFLKALREQKKGQCVITNAEQFG